MQLTSILCLAALAFSSSAVAAPAAAPALADGSVDMMVANTQWTFKGFTRTCTATDDSCTYKYTIDTHSGTPTPCTYTIKAKTASRASYNGIKCGAFTISSSWSGQFGPGKGFQTLAVVKNSQITFPAYRDSQLVNGKAVTPDQSYTPQNV